MGTLTIVPAPKSDADTEAEVVTLKLRESEQQLISHVAIQPTSDAWRRHLHQKLHIVMEQGTMFVELKTGKDSPTIAHLLSGDGGVAEALTIPLGTWYVIKPQGVLPLRFTLTQTGSYLGADDVQITKDFEDL